ncbi:MAG: hypothetical protein ACJAUS_002405 [Qipengyuania sp.]|jgi:hypothetical protein
MSALPASLSPRQPAFTLADRLAHIIRARLTGFDPRRADEGNALAVQRLTRVGPGIYEMNAEFDGQLYRVTVEREADALRAEEVEAA